MDGWMDRYSPGWEHSWSLLKKPRTTWSFRNTSQVQGCAGGHWKVWWGHVTFWELSRLARLVFFGGKKKRLKSQVVKSSLFSRNYTNPQNLGISRSMLPSWGVFVWSDGVFPTPNSSTENPTHFCVSPRLDMTWQYPENGVADGEIWFQSESFVISIISICHLSSLGMDQYLLIPFLGGWTSIYQLFWCSPGVQGFDTLPFLQPWFLHSEFTAAIGKLPGLFWWSAGKGLRRQRGHVVGWSRKAGPDDESDPDWKI